MNKRCFHTLAAGVLLAGTLAGCSKQEKEEGPKGSGKGSAEAGNKAARSETGVVTVDAATAEKVGLRTATLSAAEIGLEKKGQGRVLDAAPLAGLAAELFTARAARETSAAELKRLKTLVGQENASERALQAGEATAARDRWQVEWAQQRLVAGWGSAIASREDLAGFVESLSSMASALVQVDLPGGERLAALPTEARLVTLAGESVKGGLVGPAPTVDPQVQGQGFVFLVKPNTLRLAPGMAVTGFVAVPGERLSGVVVPESAIVRHEEAAWVYARVEGTKFRRAMVKLEWPVEAGWLIREGLKPGEAVVVSGAQTLLSEELKSQVRLGD